MMINIIMSRFSKIFDEFGIKKSKIELVESFSCNSKEELLKREGYYISHNQCVNRCVAGRTRQEYRNENKEAIQEYLK